LESGKVICIYPRDFESPDTEDADPTARVQFEAVCPDGSSFSWDGIIPATITSTENLKSVTASGSGIVRDNLGGTHNVSIDVICNDDGLIEGEIVPMPVYDPDRTRVRS
jgi:hypothetical protein